MRATSGVQLRVLLGGIDVHQSATRTTGNSATTSPLDNGSNECRQEQACREPMLPTIVPASTRELGPSNHSAITAHATAATTITTTSASRAIGRRAGPSVDSGVLVEDAADFLDRLGRGLSRVTRTHNQLGFDAVDVRALVLDDAVVALLDRARSFHRNDRMRVDARRRSAAQPAS